MDEAHGLEPEVYFNLLRAGKQYLPAQTDIEAILDDISAVLGHFFPCPETDPVTVGPHDKPMINTAWAVRSQAKAARMLMIKDNLARLAEHKFDSGVVYSTGEPGRLCTIAKVGEDYIRSVYEVDDLVIAAEEAACFVKMGRDGIKHVNPSRAVKKHIVAADYPVPVLRGVRAVPRWFRSATGEFSLAHRAGYDPSTETFISRDFDITRSEAPSEEDVKKALETLLSIIEEFPFADDSSRTNTLALMLTMAMRNIFGTAPGFVVGASDPNSGKSLLMEVLSGLVFGTIPTPLEMSYGEAEQVRRNLTAMFRDADSELLWFDEPRRSTTADAMISPLLNRALTAAAGEYRDRPVYSREVVTLDVRKVIVLTGNNLMLGDELERRTVRIMLSRSAAKFSKTEEELRELALSMQPAFHQAIATLVDNWIAKGKPSSTLVMGSFNDWAATVGGILAAAGLTNLRENTASLTDPFTHAKADWLLWLAEQGVGVRSGKSVTVSLDDIQTALTAPMAMYSGSLVDILIALSVEAPRGEVATWNGLYTQIPRGPSQRLLKAIGKAMRSVATLETARTAESQAVKIKRLERGGGFGVRYRITVP